MPFLGLSYAPPSPVTKLVQADRIALAKVSAEITPWKTAMLGLGVFDQELSGLFGPVGSGVPNQYPTQQQRKCGSPSWVDQYGVTNDKDGACIYQNEPDQGAHRYRSILLTHRN